MCPGMSRATRKVSISRLVPKGRLGKKWAFSGRKQETWSPGIRRRVRYSMTFCLSLHRQVVKAGTARMENYPM